MGVVLFWLHCITTYLFEFQEVVASLVFLLITRNSSKQTRHCFRSNSNSMGGVEKVETEESPVQVDISNNDIDNSINKDNSNNNNNSNVAEDQGRVPKTVKELLADDLMDVDPAKTSDDDDDDDEGLDWNLGDTDEDEDKTTSNGAAKGHDDDDGDDSDDEEELEFEPASTTTTTTTTVTTGRTPVKPAATTVTAADPIDSDTDATADMSEEETEDDDEDNNVEQVDSANAETSPEKPTDTSENEETTPAAAAAAAEDAAAPATGEATVVVQDGKHMLQLEDSDDDDEGDKEDNEEDTEELVLGDPDSETEAEPQAPTPTKKEPASSPEGSRRSRRQRHKPQRMQELEEASPKQQTKKSSPPRKITSPKKEGDQPNKDDLIRSTDYLFVEANKDEVTVADICRALNQEYDCKLSKPNKKIVKQHLIQLIHGEVQPQVAMTEEEEPEEEPISDQGDSDSEQSEFEAGSGNALDDEEDDDQNYNARKSRKKKPKTKTLKKKVSKPPATKKRPNARKAAKAARLVAAERIRKKRLQELKTRNEELQLNESKEDQERAEAIAARLETNSDEQRLKRLEDRLTLLQLLDRKRIAVIDALETKIEQDQLKAAAAAKTNTPETKEAEAKPEHDSEESDSSSDEEELDIVGMSKPTKPLKALHTHMPSRALDILKQIKSPDRANRLKQLAKRRTQPVSPQRLLMPSTRASSPTRVGNRDALRNLLKRKQRKQGNMWLARELGYKNEEEHLKDCRDLADKRRAQVKALEETRVQANERRLLRERLLQQEQGFVQDDEEAEMEEDKKPEEEDEELQMAKELEHEQATTTKTDASTSETSPVQQDATSPAPAVTEQAKEVATTDEPMDAPPKDEDEANAVDFSPTDADADADTDADDEAATQKWETQPPVPEVENPLTIMTNEKEDTSESTEEEAKPPTSSPEESTTKVPKEPVTDTEDKQDSAEEGPKEPVDKEDKQDSVQEETSAGADNDDEDDGEAEANFDDGDPEAEKAKKDPSRPRNAGWQAMLKKEAEALKRQKLRKKGLVEDQAEEEEEEEVAGLEDFGFSIAKKKKSDDEEDVVDDKLDEDDLKHVVDELSDDEGDEAAGDMARQRQEQREEKERHKEILRRMREGYDGRRGGIAGGGVGARGMHRFDQLVAADNREDAKRLGLLNDDELDSDNEDNEKSQTDKKGDDEDDEAALLDKMLKDRFLHRTNVDVEENFSEDEDAVAETKEVDNGNDSEAEEERTQERLARRFAKRARMQRLEEEFADTQEFSRQRLIDEDESMREELSQMRVRFCNPFASLCSPVTYDISPLHRNLVIQNGLVRHRSISSTRSSVSSSQELPGMAGMKRQRSSSSQGSRPSTFEAGGGSLSVALRASRKMKRKTSFLGGSSDSSKDSGALIHKSVSLSHVVFTRSTSVSNSNSNMGGLSRKRSQESLSGSKPTGSLFQKVAKTSQ